MGLRSGPAFISLRERHVGELDGWDPLIQRVADLFLPMRAREAEIAATALFTANELTRDPDSHPTELDVLAAVQDWKARRRPPLRLDASGYRGEGRPRFPRHSEDGRVLFGALRLSLPVGEVRPGRPARIRGRRDGSRPAFQSGRFHRLWNSFQAI